MSDTTWSIDARIAVGSATISETQATAKAPAGGETSNLALMNPSRVIFAPQMNEATRAGALLTVSRASLKRAHFENLSDRVSSLWARDKP